MDKGEFVDTNIFLEVFIRRGGKSDKCLKLLEEGKNLWTTSYVINEIEWVLRSAFEMEKGKIILYLRRVLALPNLEIEDKDVLLEALGVYEEKNVDWVDSYNSLIMKKKNIRMAFSYDKHFDKFPWVKRLEP